MSWIITGTQNLDPDAAVYIDRVETADGQSLEEGVKLAYSTFVAGCKDDGIWDAIKASCILAGARTLNGALVPLVGTAPTSYNFVAGDYDRETGLIGDGSTKYLDSNRAVDADPQNNAHGAVYVSTTATNAGAHLGAVVNTPSINRYLQIAAVNNITDLIAIRSAEFFQGSPRKTGLLGASRSASSFFLARSGGATSSAISSTSLALGAFNYLVFAQNLNNSTVLNASNARIAFYSIGESLDLALLDARVTTLMSDLAAAIP